MPFCDNCNAQLAGGQQHCGFCGAAVGRAARRRTRSEGGTVEADLFEAHARQVRHHHDLVAGIEKRIARLQREVVKAERAKPRAAARERLVRLAEEAVGLEEDWEDVQRSYNARSEGVEEEFLGRIDEMEADVELSPDRQAVLDRELEAFQKALVAAHDALRAAARRIDVATARQEGRVLAPGSPGGAGPAAALALLLGGFGGGVLAGWLQGLGPVALLGVLAPPAAAVALLLLLSARR